MSLFGGEWVGEGYEHIHSVAVVLSDSGSGYLVPFAPSFNGGHFGCVNV
jgi:hypothetical protein